MMLITKEKMLGMEKLTYIKKEYGNQILKGIVVLLFPLVLCLLFFGVRGISILDLYVPDLYNNDCFFYYKMVQGIIENGFPKGYFGFQESRAIIGSFGVWSPLILVPWAIWGILFGWGYTSPFVCNMVLLGLALMVFVLLTRMEWKNILCMLGVIGLIPCLSLYIMSCLPEVNLLSILILFFSFAIGIQYTKRKKMYIVLMGAITIYLTIIRPFMIVLAIVPCYYLFKQKIKGAFWFSAGLVVSSVSLYALGSHYFSAEYFIDVMNFSLFEYVLHGQWKDACKYVLECVRNIAPIMVTCIKEAFLLGTNAGTIYVVTIIITIISVYHIFLDKKVKCKIAHIMLVLMYVSIVGAIFLVYRQVHEGARHMFMFAVAGCMVCCSEKGIFSYISRSVLAATLIAIIYCGTLLPVDYDIPIQTEYTKVSVEYWEKAFAEHDFELSDRIGYENTLIWYLGGNYSELFGTPKGIGISCCSREYIMNHFSELKSRFIAAPVGTEVEQMCQESGFLEIGRTATTAIYQRYELE